MHEAAELQKEIDRFAELGGGSFSIAPGTYLLRDALHLRSGVHLTGEGQVTFLKKPSIQSRITDFLGYGFYEFIVEEPDLFHVGMGVHLTDKKSMGFYDTVGTIVERQGKAFILNVPLNHDYLPYDGGLVTSIFPLIEGTEVRDASLKHVILDGNIEETRILNGCRGGGVFLIRSQKVLLEEIEIRHYQGDGISFQQCGDVTVQTCDVHDNRGSGLHPGSGSVYYQFVQNRVTQNGGCGLFYCLRTTHSLCENNHFEGNAHTGISIGERDTDHHLKGNTIIASGHDGIGFRQPIAQGGDRVSIEANTLRGNGTDRASFEILIPPHIHEVTLIQNSIEPVEGRAISIGAECHHILCAENQIAGRPQRDSDIEGFHSGIVTNMPASPPQYGIDSFEPKSVRHIQVVF